MKPRLSYVLTSVGVLLWACFLALIIFLIIKKTARRHRTCKRDSKLLRHCLPQLSYEELGGIPKRVWQTYHTKALVPKEVIENRRVYAAGYECTLMDDADSLTFLQTYFSNAVVRSFSNLVIGAHKADVLRYALLYVWGGVYIDIKTELIKPLEDVFTQPAHVHTVLSVVKNTIYQGIIAARPRQGIFLTLIYRILKTPREDVDADYLLFTKQFYEDICARVHKTALGPGWHVGDTETYFLMPEACSNNKTSNDCWDGLDRHGVCCFVKDETGKSSIIKVRYASYPWK